MNANPARNGMQCGATTAQVIPLPRDHLPDRPGGVEEASRALSLLRAEYARLLAAARASVTAARDGTADPLVYVAAELARHGGLPPQDATVPRILADARTAMTLAAGSLAWPVQGLSAVAADPAVACAASTEPSLCCK